MTVETRARLVVLATGLGAESLLSKEAAAPKPTNSRSRIGAGLLLDIGSKHPTGLVTMCCAANGDGYVGLVRLPDGRLDLAAALAPAAIRKAGSIGKLVGKLLDHDGLELAEYVTGAKWNAVPRLTQRPWRLGAERVLLVGDAAGYVEPFTGEGIGWAMKSALAAAPLAVRAIDQWTSTVIKEWERAHRRAVGRQQARCRLVCGAIGGTPATRVVVSALSRAPWLARPIVRSIDGVGATPERITACP